MTALSTRALTTPSLPHHSAHPHHPHHHPDPHAPAGGSPRGSPYGRATPLRLVGGDEHSGAEKNLEDSQKVFRRPKVTRGGDGGAAPSPKVNAQALGSVHGLDNRRVVLTGADPAECRPTSDPFDRAHNQRDGGGRLLSGAVMDSTRGCYKPRGGTKPRCYHPSQLVARQYATVLVLDADGHAVRREDGDALTRRELVGGVSIDSAFDGLYEAQQRLGDIPGLGVSVTVGQVVARSAAAMVARVGYKAAYNRAHQKTRQEPER